MNAGDHFEWRHLQSQTLLLSLRGKHHLAMNLEFVQKAKINKYPWNSKSSVNIAAMIKSNATSRYGTMEQAGELSRMY